MEYSKSLQEKRQEDEERVTSSEKTLRYMYNNITSEGLISSTDDRIARDTLAEMHVQDVDAQPRSEVEERGN